MNKEKSKLAVFISFSGQGGVEKVIVNLCRGLSHFDILIDLLVVKSQGLKTVSLPSSINVIKLGTRHTYTSLFPLIRYLKTEKPDVLLSSKHRGNQVAILAKRLSGVPTRVVMRLDTTVSAALEGKGAWRKLVWSLAMKMAYVYGKPDKIITVSEGVKKDLICLTGVSEDLVTAIPNPVVSDKMVKLSLEPIKHSWFVHKTKPVILGAGRLTRQKDFSTLIKAFKIVRSQMPSRLMILGEGPDRRELESLGRKLNLLDDLAFAGYVSNPYAYFSRADVFALSSVWEGLPTVLIEAMALGLPVVSTDCPSGADEILQKGRFGALVPVGDHVALATAIIDTIKSPRESNKLIDAIGPYRMENSSDRYFNELVGQPSLT